MAGIWPAYDYPAADASGYREPPPLLGLYIAMLIIGPLFGLGTIAIATQHAKDRRWNNEKQAKLEVEGGARDRARAIEATGLAAEEQGNWSAALASYVQSLKAHPSPLAFEDEDRLRSRIIAAARQCQPPPTMGEEAARAWGLARGALKAATHDSDMEASLRHFRELLLEAAWVADFYYNHAAALEYLGQYEGAARNLKWYLLAAPDAWDKLGATARMHEFEFRAKSANPSVTRAGVKALLDATA